MEIGAISWNLFHGRDFPPDAALHTWRSRVARAAERNATHIQVNRELFREFAQVLCAARWDVALLQECPPRWAAALAATCEASAQRSLTSRNWLGPVRSILAGWNPDLLGSWEGGSNLTLVKGPGADGLLDERELVLRRLPERRTMAFARLDSGLCVANLHASTRPPLAEADVRHAVETAVAWAGESPLILGGDFNLRPNQTRLFGELARRFGLSAPTGPDSIDHILSRGLEIVDPPGAWPPEARELPCEGLRLRLSDHAPVEARFAAHMVDPPVAGFPHG
ncbi:MAG: endonuclease/exonuclease/phosphatase family protein [Actinomycetota bacterium]